MWIVTHRACPIGKQLADRHYNRQNPQSKQFVPPGKCVVLTHASGKAVWVTSWPIAKYVKHAWAGAWVNSLFRNEGAGKGKKLIQEAVDATLRIWPEPPKEGLITFVDVRYVKEKKDPGHVYLMAGFRRVGETKGGLIAWHMSYDRLIRRKQNMTETQGFPPFQGPAPMFDAPVAQANGPEPKKRGRKPKVQAAPVAVRPDGTTVNPPKKRGRPKGYSPKAGKAKNTATEAKTLTELMFGCDAPTAKVLETIVTQIQSLPESSRKGMIAALQRIWP